MHAGMRSLPADWSLSHKTALTFLFALWTHFARLHISLVKTNALLSIVKARMVGISLMYLALSLWYTGLHLAFHLDLSRYMSAARAFLLLWLTNCLTTL